MKSLKYLLLIVGAQGFVILLLFFLAATSD